jgi:hypothetical protein
MKKNVKVLPDKFSEVLLLALKCIDEVNQDDNYVFDERRWHEYCPTTNKTHVSPFGCVMAKYFGYERTRGCLPVDFTFGKRLAATDLVYKNDDLHTAFRWGCNIDPLRGYSLLMDFEKRFSDPSSTQPIYKMLCGKECLRAVGKFLNEQGL